MGDIAANLAAVRQRIAEAAARAGRDAGGVALVAVGKTWPAERLLEAYEAGQRLFGENRVQELEEKAAALPEAVEWHLIGPLQRNKAAKALEHAAMIETLDSLALARRLDRLAEERGRRVSVCLQVNISADPAKSGYAPEAIERELDAILDLPRLSVRGLMTVPEYRADPEEVRPDFAALRELRDGLEARAGQPFPVLSMGMSHDYEIAIEEGATHVRVGSSIFGPRSRRDASLGGAG